MLILDNINALCTNINKDGQPNLLETIKSEKFTEIVTEWINK